VIILFYFLTLVYLDFINYYLDNNLLSLFIFFLAFLGNKKNFNIPPALSINPLKDKKELQTQQWLKI